MKLSRQIRLWVLLQFLLSALILAGMFTSLPLAACAALWVVLQGGLIVFAIFRVEQPARTLEDGMDFLQENTDYNQETLHAAGEENVFLARIAPVIEHYAEEMTRKNTARIFDKQTQLTALQSQINPHFLYNTLETIRGQALLDDNLEIARMTEALGAFFRYSISRKGNLVTLRDELANINNYMLIQQYRFSNRFTLEVVIDEEDEAAYDFLVPRLIIQPVVENAIFHGLEDLDEGGRVVIEIMVTEQNLYLMISDNGKGMDEPALAALNERIHAGGGGTEDPKEGTRRTGIALPNIHRRIQLLFGQEYGVHVYSTQGRGTDVEICIPISNERVEAG